MEKDEAAEIDTFPGGSFSCWTNPNSQLTTTTSFANLSLVRDKKEVIDYVS